MLNKTFANNSKSDRALQVDRASVFDAAKASNINISTVKPQTQYMTKRSSQILPKTKECWTTEQERVAHANPPLLTTNQHQHLENRPTTSLMASKAHSTGMHTSSSTNMLSKTHKLHTKLNVVKHKLQPHWKNIIRSLSQ